MPSAIIINKRKNSRIDLSTTFQSEITYLQQQRFILINGESLVLYSNENISPAKLKTYSMIFKEKENASRIIDNIYYTTVFNKV